MMRRAAFLLFLLPLACNKTPPELAPEAVDANLRWFWVHGDVADDTTLLDAAGKLAVSGKADTRTTPLKGQMRERLTSDDLKNVGLEANDPKSARGLIVVNLFDCTLGKLEPILIAQDQSAQYVDVYRSYVRSYTSDADAFTARSSDVLTWTVDSSSALPIDDVYSSTLKGGVRRVRGASDGPTKGDFLVTRTYLTAPATFTNPAGGSWFRQDYQIEVFWEQAPGRIFHAYGMWRDINVGGFGLSVEDDGLMNIVLDNLVAWDTKTAELCARP